MYDKLVSNVNVISNSGFVLIVQYSTHKSGYKNKVDDMSTEMPDTSGFVKKPRLEYKNIWY